MHVELLVVTDRPNEPPTYERLRQALDVTGHEDTPIAAPSLDDLSRAVARRMPLGQASDL